MTLSIRDREIIRGWRGKWPDRCVTVQEQKFCGETANNVRPMVMIDQVWNEMNVDNELTLSVKMPNAGRPAEKDSVSMEAFSGGHGCRAVYRIPKAVTNSGFGVTVKFEEISVGDPTNSVADCFTNQFETDADLDKIKMPSLNMTLGRPLAG